ncbi:MAG: ATP-dependent metallopeptidase FtsH/Yme1/Tma family protein [Pseudonocardiaceae bacterium]
MPETPFPSPVGWPARLRDAVRSRLGRDPAPASPPWRVEGLPNQPAGPSRQQRPSWSRFWWVLLALLAINWIVSGLLLGPAPRTPVSYTFFVSQVDAGNVKDITATGDQIEGTSKREVP